MNIADHASTEHHVHEMLDFENQQGRIQLEHQGVEVSLSAEAEDMPEQVSNDTFQYKNEHNELQGAMRQVSLGLTEEYKPIFVQQIDLAV